MIITAIDGMAGVGKTTLAVHWAHRIAHLYPDGQLYVNLHGFDAVGTAADPSNALRSVLSTLGVPTQQLPGTLDAQSAMYRSLLSGKRMLVLLDNARDAEQARPLLPAANGCLVIVTSRSPLAGLVAGEGAHLARLGLFTAEAARESIERRIGPARVRAEPAAVAEIIERCGLLPLTLAIVSARAAAHPSFTLTEIAADLRQAQGSWTASARPLAPTRAACSPGPTSTSAARRPGCSGCFP